MADSPSPDHLIVLPDGRRVAVDDRGDPSGVPVLYLHGTPDSRLARHPDDSIAAAAGVRLLAVDRPGIGHSDVDPRATPERVADVHVAVLDALGIDRASVLAWSAGAVFGLALAGTHPDRLGRLVLAAPLVPADAYGDDGVLDGADDARRLFADAHRGLDPGEAGRELAMWLVPPEIDEPTAGEMLAESLEAVRGITGAGRALIAALQASVRTGMTGVEREIAAQATPLSTTLDSVAAPAEVHVGDRDTVTPPAMARWVAARIGASLDVHGGLGHSLPFHRWAELLGRCRP